MGLFFFCFVLFRFGFVFSLSILPSSLNARSFITMAENNQGSSRAGWIRQPAQTARGIRTPGEAQVSSAETCPSCSPRLSVPETNPGHPWTHGNSTVLFIDEKVQKGKGKKRFICYLLGGRKTGSLVKEKDSVFVRFPREVTETDSMSICCF